MHRIILVCVSVLYMQRWFIISFLSYWVGAGSEGKWDEIGKRELQASSCRRENRTSVSSNPFTRNNTLATNNIQNIPSKKGEIRFRQPTDWLNVQSSRACKIGSFFCRLSFSCLPCRIYTARDTERHKNVVESWTEWLGPSKKCRQN